MTPTLTFLAGLFVGGVFVVVAIVVAWAFGRSFGGALGRRVNKLVKVDSSKVDMSKLTRTKPQQDPKKDWSDVGQTDTAIVRSALTTLKFSKVEIDWACDQIRNRTAPVAEKIRFALVSLERAKRERNHVS